MASHDGTTSRQPGSQTLARGLTALLAIVDAPEGLTVGAVSASLGVHRSIAYRILQTLSDFGMVVRSHDGTYLPGARLAALSDSYLPHIRHVAVPVMRSLADQLGATISLFVREGHEAVAVEMVEPTTATHHIALRVGMRTPLDRGAAAYALLSTMPAAQNEPPGVTAARERGYGFSHGEVDPGAYALAAALPGARPAACLNLITYRDGEAEKSAAQVMKAAQDIGARLT